MTHTKQKAAVRVAAILTMVLAILVTVSFTGCQLTSLLPGTTGPNTTVPTEPLGGDLPDQSIVVPTFLHPLTGLEATEVLSKARPISICIGNTAYALPQYGISNADILVEIPVEGGITRLMMITNDYSNIDKIGSVRSTRPGLAAIANSFDSIQLYAGTSDEGESSLLPYDTMDYIMQNLPTVYYRETEINAPNNLMTNGSLISDGIQSFGYRTEISEAFALPYNFVDFGTVVAPVDGFASYIQMNYSSSHTIEFLYDSNTKTYAREQFGEQQIDGNNGNSLDFENVFILFSNTVTHETANGTTIDLHLENGGEGVWCSEGMQQSIFWNINEDGNVQFFDSNGSILTVNRGTSYIGFMKASMPSALKIQ